MERASTRRSLLWVLLTLSFLASAAQAQVTAGPSLTVTVLGGASIDGDLTPGLADVNTVLEPGWLTAIHTEYYFGSGIFGVRAAGAFTIRELDDGSGKFNVWDAALGALMHPPLLAFTESVQPYVTVSPGVTTYKAVPGSTTFARGRFGPDPVARLHVTAAVGADMAVLPRLAVRLEAGDRITLPSIGNSPPSNGLPNTHTPLVLLGVQYRFGAPDDHPHVNRPEPRREMAPEAPPEEVEAVETEAEPEVAPAEPTPTPETDTDPVTGFTVQVGTFLTPATARSWGERLASRGIPVWYLDRMLGGTEVTRIRAGAVPREVLAHELAAYIEAEFGWDTDVDEIGLNEPIPQDAMALTSEFLDRR